MTGRSKVDFQALKRRHRAQRDGYPQALSLRLHRSLSWLDNAEQHHQDVDSAFIFYWIAFNAAYGYEAEPAYRSGESQAFRQFLEKIVDLDSHGRLEKLVWQQFSGPIRVLLDNQYIFQPFWEYQQQRISELEWRSRFDNAKTSVHQAMASRQTAQVLGIICHRLYTLRNQLIHGGATWHSGINRDAMRDCHAVMAALVPTILIIMMDNPDTLWGPPAYPVVGT
ncbi:hypothetical protein [Shewanella sp. GXUN23E]|uniref:hypothetical protein n=1 Tax=Shewanella sp. GXUN23E TaxID=3422498 RepID=UPI003D7E7632